jgi:hypothetical protein
MNVQIFYKKLVLICIKDKEYGLIISLDIISFDITVYFYLLDGKNKCFKAFSRILKIYSQTRTPDHYHQTPDHYHQHFLSLYQFKFCFSLKSLFFRKYIVN